MEAAHYFELVDAVARVDKQSDLAAVSARITSTTMHPLERRVLERAVRARRESLALRDQITLPGLFEDLGVSPEQLSAGG